MITYNTKTMNTINQNTKNSQIIKNQKINPKTQEKIDIFFKKFETLIKKHN